MNIFNLLKFASKLDKQGKYSTSDFVFKFVKAQTDDFDFSQDPLGMSVPNERKDKFADLRRKLESGEISEDQFKDLFIEMVETTPHANAGDIDNFQTRLQDSGIQTFGQDRAFLERATEFADTLYVLGVKDCNSYLPSDEEVAQMIKQGQAAMKNKEPSPEDKKRLASANLDGVRAQQILTELSGHDAETQLDYMALAQGKPKVYS